MNRLLFDTALENIQDAAQKHQWYISFFFPLAPGEPKDYLFNLFNDLRIPNMVFTLKNIWDVLGMDCIDMKSDYLENYHLLEDIFFETPECSFIFKFNYNRIQGRGYGMVDWDNFVENMNKIIAIYLPNKSFFFHPLLDMVIIADRQQLEQYIKDNNNNIFFDPKSRLEPLRKRPFQLSRQSATITFYKQTIIPGKRIKEGLIIELINKCSNLSATFLNNNINVFLDGHGEKTIIEVFLAGVYHNNMIKYYLDYKKIYFIGLSWLNLLLILAILKQDEDNIVGLHIEPTELFYFGSKEEAIALLDNLLARELARFFKY